MGVTFSPVIVKRADERRSLLKARDAPTSPASALAATSFSQSRRFQVMSSPPVKKWIRAHSLTIDMRPLPGKLRIANNNDPGRTNISPKCLLASLILMGPAITAEWKCRARPIHRATGAQDVSGSEGFKRVYGIDLGTTYSAIAYVDEHGKSVIVPNQESERITPSVVLFDGENVIAGNTAKESAKVEPHRVVTRVKQHMGDPNYVFEHDGQVYSPEDISSFILRKVVGDAALALGEEAITDVVITCPAYFGTAEREATANAGRLAG